MKHTTTLQILMVTPYVPYPPASGGQIRTLNLLKNLSKRHKVTLVALSKNKEKDSRHISELKSYCENIYLCHKTKNPWQLTNILRSVFSDKPFLTVRNFSGEAKDTITKVLDTKKFDVIHAETFYVMPMIPNTNVPILLVEQTIEFLVYTHFVRRLPKLVQPLFMPDIYKLRKSECHYWSRAALVATVSKQDRDTVIIEDKTITPIVIPNGAGEDLFLETLPKKTNEKQQILFQGNFSWLQNTEAARHLIDSIFPLLKKRLPHASIVIAGQGASGKITSRPGVHVIDIDSTDTDTVKSLYRDSTVFIAPIFGPGGTRLKILAAMASGLPVVASPTGIQGLEVTPGKDVLVATTPNEFSDQVVKLLTENELYQSVRKHAHHQVVLHYNWKSITLMLERAYDTIRRHTT